LMTRKNALHPWQNNFFWIHMSNGGSHNMYILKGCSFFSFIYQEIIPFLLGTNPYYIRN
jgi:hypothetical protein